MLPLTLSPKFICNQNILCKNTGQENPGRSPGVSCQTTTVCKAGLLLLHHQPPTWQALGELAVDRTFGAALLDLSKVLGSE